MSQTKIKQILELSYDSKTKYELSIDEVGRGCLFGRTYIACAVLPKDGSFDGKNVKDSKKFSSKKKIKEVSDYIKQNALFWHIEYIENDVIDKINILQSVMQGMHKCIQSTVEQIKNSVQQNGHVIGEYENEYMAIIDGNYFNPYLWFDDKTQTIKEFPAVTVEQGDAKYMGIAAASILAKVARDEYIIELCDKYPILTEYYHLEKNMGYGTKLHLDGIAKYGITNWHRKTFGLCKTMDVTVSLDETPSTMSTEFSRSPTTSYSARSKQQI